MKINVMTGFGYIKNEHGVVISKAILPIGEHEINDGYSYTDVNKESDLDSIIVYPNVTQEYLDSKEYARDIFEYNSAMEDLNIKFWDRMTVLAPVVGLVDLWIRWKNFSALKTKCLEWVSDDGMNFSIEDFNILNDVLKLQNIDMMDW